MKIGVGEFKAKCLKLVGDVQKYHEEIVITKHGVPMAKVVHIEPENKSSIFGYMKGTIVIKGDIVASTGEKWDADE